MKIRANGININCKIDGPEDAPWLVFSNSLGTDISMWDDQVAKLKDRFRILRYDHRGHGGTDAPEGAYNFDQLIGDLVGILDALGIERAHYCGLSMGGITGEGFVEKYPSRVDKLVICDCTGASTPAGAQQWAERIAIAKEKGIEGLVDITVERWFSPESYANDAKAVARVKDMVRKTPVNGFIGCAHALSEFDFKAGLGEIKAQTLLIVGSKDAAYPGVKFLNGAISGSKMVEIEGAGHLSNIEQPEAFTQALSDFLG
jgi:3-oxoadipate enol-lactonase